MYPKPPPPVPQPACAPGHPANMEAPLLPQLNFIMEDDDVQLDVAPSVSANGEGGPSPSTALAPPWAMSSPPVPEAARRIPLHLRFEGIQQTQLFMADVLPLVVSPLPQSPRRIRVCPSIIIQIDAGPFKLYKARLERDVMAGSVQESHTTFYGLPSYRSISTGTNLFVHDPELMARVVNTAARHRANGVFIVPQLAGPPMLPNRDKLTPWLQFSSQRRRSSSSYPQMLSRAWDLILYQPRSWRFLCASARCPASRPSFTRSAHWGTLPSSARLILHESSLQTRSC